MKTKEEEEKQAMDELNSLCPMAEDDLIAESEIEFVFLFSIPSFFFFAHFYLVQCLTSSTLKFV